jgi:hypothetical protein
MFNKNHCFFKVVYNLTFLRKRYLVLGSWFWIDSTYYNINSINSIAFSFNMGHSEKDDQSPNDENDHNHDSGDEEDVAVVMALLDDEEKEEEDQQQHEEEEEEEEEEEQDDTNHDIDDDIHEVDMGSLIS